MSKQNIWYLGCPAPSFGVIADGYYHAGPMMQDDREGKNTDDTRLQVVTGVSETDFDAYLNDIKASGITVGFENKLGYDRFFAFESNGMIYHVGYFAKKKEMRITEDPVSMLPDEFGYRVKGEKKTTVYQYGLYYDPYNRVTTYTVNCGMLYIIRLSDNSLFMIDAGHFTQWNEEASDALWKFLLSITDTPENGKIRISCWYFTHGHNDHTDGCIRLLDQHHDQIVLERVMHGFPSYLHCGGYSVSVYEMKQKVMRYYPDVKLLKLHTGQEMYLADVKAEVLYAHEDAARAEDLSRIFLGDFNCTSSVLKLTIDGKIVMMLGDTNVETEEIVTANSDPAIWKADMVQVGHHCFNYLDTLYAWIAAPAAMMPNSYFGCHTPENLPKLATLMQFVKNGQIYYEGSETTAFEAGENGFVKVGEYPLVGGPYDFSWKEWEQIPGDLQELPVSALFDEKES